MDIPKMNAIRLVVKNPRVPVKGLGELTEERL